MKIYMDNRIMKSKNKYEGKIYYNTFGTPFKILEYNYNNNILIEFQDEYKYHKTTDINTENADVNEDGAINVKDLLELRTMI